MDLVSRGAEVTVSATSVRDVDASRLPCVVMVGPVARHRLAWSTGLLAAGLLLAACSSGASDEVIPLTTPETTVPAVTSAPPTSSTSTAAPTPVPSTSTAPLPSSTTVQQPTSSTTTTEDLRFEIEADLNAGRASFVAAAAEPVDAAGAGLNRWFGGDALARSIETLAGFAARGEAARAGPSALELVEVESAQLIGDGVAVVIYCLSSDSVVYVVDGGQVVNDEIGSFRSSATMSRSGDTWRVDGRMTLSTFEVVGCE